MESVQKSREHAVTGLAGSPECVFLRVQGSRVSLRRPRISISSRQQMGWEGEGSESSFFVRELWAGIFLLEVSGVGKEEVVKFGEWVRRH